MKTIQQVIDELQQVKNKDRIMKLAVNGVVTANFHINDAISTRVYLSNKEEEGYKEPEID